MATEEPQWRWYLVITHQCIETGCVPWRWRILMNCVQNSASMGDSNARGWIQCSMIADMRGLIPGNLSLGHLALRKIESESPLTPVNQCDFSWAKHLIVNAHEAVCSLYSLVRLLTKSLYHACLSLCDWAVNLVVLLKECLAAMTFESSWQLSVLNAETSSLYLDPGGVRSYIDNCQKVT